MCGRAYSTYSAEELYFQYLNRKPLSGEDLPFSKPNYNMAPTQTVPVVRQVNGGRSIDAMRWGLIPPWEKQFSTKISTINARSEGVFESRLYKSHVVKRRCIVPISGFFEWKREGTSKCPFKIFLKDSPIMALAGIWSTWHEGSPDEGKSFSIVTTSANPVMEKIHDRMPVILRVDQFDDWLSPEMHEPEHIGQFLKPYP